MKIIPYQPTEQEDLERFMEIVYETMGYNFDPTGLHSDIRKVVSTYSETGGEFWLLQNKDELVGTIALKIIDQVEKIGEVKRFFILNEYQGKGLGKELMGHVIQFSMEKKLKKLRLDTMKKSIKALAVFKHFGFYEIPKYNDNDIAEIFMEKEINYDH